VLEEHYLPVREAFLATFGPCHFSTDWSLCRQRNSAFAAAGRRLLAALAPTHPPARLANADETLRRGVNGLVGLVTEQNACIDTGKGDACARFSLCCNPSGVDLNNAISELNALAPSANLPPPNE
jgi:hypothetical protein